MSLCFSLSPEILSLSLSLSLSLPPTLPLSLIHSLTHSLTHSVTHSTLLQSSPRHATPLHSTHSLTLTHSPSLVACGHLAPNFVGPYCGIPTRRRWAQRGSRTRWRLRGGRRFSAACKSTACLTGGASLHRADVNIWTHHMLSWHLNGADSSNGQCVVASEFSNLSKKMIQPTRSAC